MERPLIHVISRRSFPHSFLVFVIQGGNCCLFGVYGTSNFLERLSRMARQFFRARMIRQLFLHLDDTEHAKIFGR